MISALSSVARAPSTVGLAPRVTLQPALALLAPGLGRRAALTIGLVAALLIVRAILGGALRLVERSGSTTRSTFWVQQALALLTLAALVFGVLAIWIDEPSRFGAAFGLVGAGFAVALQRVVTAFAGYLIILRGKLFTVGDRITMGGVRGDVVALGFMQTTVMEMGQSPPEQAEEPAVWVRSRQYTGRIVRVTNDRIFEMPIYNLTREFQFLWEELMLPIDYRTDRARAETIMLEAARTHTREVAAHSAPALEALKRRYPLDPKASVEPQVYWNITADWLELTLRFVVPARGARGIKDAIAREVLRRFDEERLEIATTTQEIVGMPPLRVQVERGG